MLVRGYMRKKNIKLNKQSDQRMCRYKLIKSHHVMRICTSKHKACVCSTFVFLPHLTEAQSYQMFITITQVPTANIHKQNTKGK